MSVAALGACATDIFDNHANRAYFGMRVGLDLVCPGEIKTSYGASLDWYNPRVGFDAGVIYNTPLWKNLYIEPGVSLYYNAAMSVRQFGFRVPVRVGYRFDFGPASVNVFTGPRLEIGVVGRDHRDIVGTYFNENAFGRNGDFHRFDLGWQFGAGISRGRFIFEIAGTAGLLDIASGEESLHKNNVQFAVGYNF